MPCFEKDSPLRRAPIPRLSFVPYKSPLRISNCCRFVVVPVITTDFVIG